jgi:hypothetical protein
MGGSEISSRFVLEGAGRERFQRAEETSETRWRSDGGKSANVVHLKISRRRFRKILSQFLGWIYSFYEIQFYCFIAQSIYS